MMCCPKHWEELRGAIRERGLEKYVAQGGAEAKRRIETGQYEPLLMANGALAASALLRGGRELLFTDCCPACEIARLCDCGGKLCGLNAIADAADGALNEARKRGLLGSC